MGTLRIIHPIFSGIDNDITVGVCSADADGYYFVRSGKNVQSLKRGSVQSRLFLFDGLGRQDLDLTPESFSETGVKIGDNTAIHIGGGIYEITPLTLEKSIVKVLDSFYSSFPNAELAVDCPDEKTSTVLRITPKQKKAGVTIGGSDIISNIQDSSLGLRVSQTIFRI